MNKNKLSAAVIILGVMVSGSIIGSAMAQTLQPQEQKMPGDIQFPVKELGNCASKEDCKIFCDNTKNTEACLKFAEEKNLLSPEELAMAKKFKEAGMIGPGGCRGQVECDAYCGDQDHMEECITFAIKNGMMDQKKQEESQKVLAALKRGVKPPACSGPEACDKYCSSSAHMEECMNFGIEAGIMDEQKQGEAKKVLAAIKRGVKMPACNGPEECDAYCSSAEHMEECINFSVEAGMMPEQDKEKAQKTLEAIKQGIKPPACKGEQECQAYCAQESHVEECIKFGEATGMMKPEDAAMMRKTGGKGPGGCIGKEACQVFCDNPDNQETCFQFGKDNGMIPEADLKKMEEGQQKMRESFSQIPQEVLDCISSSLGADVVEKMKNGSMVPQKAGETIGQCFQKFGIQENRPNQNQNGQDQQGQDQQIQPWADMCQPDANGNPTELACVDGSGEFVASAKVGSDKEPVCPSGSTAKCGNYPQNNQQGKPGNNFQPGPGAVNQGGQQMPQQAGPGGCKGPEECKAYCESHQEECKNFQPQQGQPGGAGGPNQGQGGSVGGPGNNNGGGGQSGWSNGTGNGGGNGGPNQGQGSNPGSGQNGNGPGMGIEGTQFAPGTQQMDKLSPEIEKEMRAKIEEAVRNGQLPAGVDGGNFELKDIKQFQNIQNQLPLQGGPVPAPNQPGQYIQGQPGQSQQMIQGQPNQQMQPGQQNQPGQFIQGQQGQPGQQQGMQPPQGQQSPMQQQTPPPPPSSFVQKLLGSVMDVFRK